MSDSNFAADVFASTGNAAAVANKNATSKQYDVRVVLKITEAGGKAFYDADTSWTGVPYGFVVAIEKELLTILNKTADLGTAVATGGPATKP